MSDPTRDQLDMDRADSLYDELCWMADRAELSGEFRSGVMEWAEFVADEGRRRAASMQFDTQEKSGPIVPQRRDVA